MLAMDEATKKTNERRLFRKLEGRARLMGMADEARRQQLDPKERELQSLRAYLADWRYWQEGYRPKLGAPSMCSWAGKQTPEVHSATEYLERSDKWAMEVIERSVEDLRKRTDGEALRAALRVRLLNESIPAAVFRHGRLAGIAPAEVEALADRAEWALVKIVKAYGLPL